MRAAICVALLLLVSGFAIAGGNEDAAVWRLKADEPLLKAIDEGQDPLTLVVQGPRIREPVTTPVDRAAWRDDGIEARRGDLRTERSLRVVWSAAGAPDEQEARPRRSARKPRDRLY
jgi:hypothetical protein